MNIRSHGLCGKRRGDAYTPRALFCGFTLGILLMSSGSGCSSRAHPLLLGFGAAGFAPTPKGLAELLDRMPAMQADERRQQLQLFTQSSAPSALKQKAAYVLARELELNPSADDTAQAIDLYRQASALAPLSERCLWHMVDCASKSGNEKAAREALTKLAACDKPDTRQAAEYALGQSYMRANERDLARRTFSRLVTQAPQSQYALGSTYYLAELDLADNAQANKPASGTSDPSATVVAPDPATAAANAARALAAFKHYLKESPGGRFALDIANQLKSMPEFKPDISDHNLLAGVFYASGDYNSALDQWRQAGNTSEWFKQAACLLRLGKTAEGKKALSDGISSHPADESVPEAATLLCRYLNHDSAVAVWNAVLKRSPRFGDTASYNLAIRAPNDATALGYYKRIAGLYQSSAYAPESLWWIAWYSVRSGKSQDALASLQSGALRYPDAKAAPRFLFWMGKMYERLGNKTAAKAAYGRTINKAPWHYYAHRAQQRLAALSGGKDAGWRTDSLRRVQWSDDTSQEWNFPEPPAELSKQEGETVELLTELKQWDECLELVPQSSGLLRGFYFAKQNLPLEAINAAGKALHGRPQTTEGWQLAYPLLYARFIASEAPTKQVDPLLVQALIREESRYNPQAVSSSRAIGLMQLMPGTAYGVAKRLSIPLASTSDIHDPEKNIRMGIDYFSYVQKRFKGNSLFAVASYNGGPNAVQHWASHMPSDTDIFVEDIPFKETREYVRKVFGSYWNYEAIYAAPRTARAHS